MQNALYIVHFWKKVVISFERGDIDVRPSHVKLILFLQILECIYDFAHFLGNFSLAHKHQAHITHIARK